MECAFDSDRSGRIPYERIGEIHMLVNGNLDHVVNLADRLSTLETNHPSLTTGHWLGEEPVSAFQKWKKKTLRKRKTLGFPVV